MGGGRGEVTMSSSCETADPPAATSTCEPDRDSSPSAMSMPSPRCDPVDPPAGPADIGASNTGGSDAVSSSASELSACRFGARFCPSEVDVPEPLVEGCVIGVRGGCGVAKK